MERDINFNGFMDLLNCFFKHKTGFIYYFVGPLIFLSNNLFPIYLKNISLYNIAMKKIN